MIQDAAAKCRYCGEWLDPAKRPAWSAPEGAAAPAPAPASVAPPSVAPAAADAPQFAAPPAPSGTQGPAPAPVPRAAAAPPAPGFTGSPAPVVHDPEPAPPPGPPATAVPPDMTTSDGSVHHAVAGRQRAGQSWSAPAWLSDEDPTRPEPRRAEPSSQELTPVGTSLEEVALRMQRIKASAAAVRQAVQAETSRREAPEHEPAATHRPVQYASAAHAPQQPAVRHHAEEPAPHYAEPQPPAQQYDDPAAYAEPVPQARPQAAPVAERMPPRHSTASGEFEARPVAKAAGGYEDAFLGGDLDDDLDDEYDADDSLAQGEISGFGDVAAARPVPWKPILIAATFVLAAVVYMLSSYLWPGTEPVDTEQDEGDVAAGSVAPPNPTQASATKVAPPPAKAAQAPAPPAKAAVDPAAAAGAVVPPADPGVPVPAEPSAPGDAGAPAGEAPPTQPSPAPSGAVAPPAGAPPTPPAPAAGAVPPAVTESLDKARGLYKKGSRSRLVAAGEILTEVLEKHPNLPDALLLMAQVQLERGERAVALETATKCTQLAQLADCWLTIGTLQQDRKEYPAAVEAYENYLSLAPDGQYSRDVRKQVARLKKK